MALGQDARGNILPKHRGLGFPWFGVSMFLLCFFHVTLFSHPLLVTQQVFFSLEDD